MAQRIVVGVDASETAYAAARTAAEMAVAFGAELKVVSSYDKFQRERIQLGSEELIFSTEQDALQVATDVVNQLQVDFPTATMSAVTTVGKPGEALVQAAEQFGADLIVVGNKRVQGITRVLGSVARDVSAHASCDVYVVNTHAAK